MLHDRNPKTCIKLILAVLKAFPALHCQMQCDVSCNATKCISSVSANLTLMEPFLLRACPCLYCMALFILLCVCVCVCVCVCQREVTLFPGRNMFQVWGSGGFGLSLIRADTQDGTGTHSPCLFLDLAQSRSGL